MSENNNTKELSDSEKIDWLIRELTMVKAIVEDRFDSIEDRMTKLELTVEDRLKDTRPIWQAINTRTERIEELLSQIKDQMRELAYSDLELRGQQSRLSQRMSDLDNRMTGD